MGQRCEIAYVPFIEGKGFQFGNASFWQFYEAETQKVFTPKELDYLEWYFGKYEDSAGNKLQSIIIVGIGEKVLGPWSASEREEIRDSVLLLCMLSTWKVDAFFPLVPDNFKLFFKSFNPKDKTLAYRVGGYLRKTCIISGDYAELIRFPMPENLASWNWVFEQSAWFNDRAFFEGMSKALTTARKEEWFLRMARATRVYSTSFQNIEELGYFDRILLIVTALEILLNPESQSGTEFAKALVKLIGTRNTAEYSNEINERLFGFADAIYKIRSRYSHGKELGETEAVHPEYGEFYRVALQTFGLACRYTLIDRGLVECKERDFQVYMDAKSGLFHLMEETRSPRR
jgi:hypothetical protein